MHSFLLMCYGWVVSIFSSYEFSEVFILRDASVFLNVKKQKKKTHILIAVSMAVGLLQR